MKLYEIIGPATQRNDLHLVEGRADINHVITQGHAIGSEFLSEDLGGAFRNGAQNASRINDWVKKSARTLQNTKPVANFDAKVEELQKKYSQALGDDSKTMAAVDRFARFGKTYPKSTAFIIGVLAGLTTVATGPGGGMLVGAALRTATGLLQGEKASTAIGKAATVGAVGALAGMAARELAEVIMQTVNSWDWSATEFELDEKKVGGITQTTVLHNVSKFGRDYEFFYRGALTHADQGKLDQLMDIFHKAVDANNPISIAKSYAYVNEFIAKTFGDIEYQMALWDAVQGPIGGDTFNAGADFAAEAKAAALRNVEQLKKFMTVTAQAAGSAAAERGRKK